MLQLSLTETYSDLFISLEALQGCRCLHVDNCTTTSEGATRRHKYFVLSAAEKENGDPIGCFGNTI